MSSSGSLHELHTTSSADGHLGIPLTHIIAVWRLDDGRPYFSIEIDHFDDDTNVAGCLTLQLHDPREFDLWMSSIRGAVIKARLANSQLFISQSLIEYTARAVEQEEDYDPNNFQLYKVTQRAGKTGPRSSSEDLTKVTSTICILAIGVHKVHLVPLPRVSGRASSTSLSDFNGTCHGLLTLTHLNVHEQDDAFSLTFRPPFRQSSTLTLASSLVNDIALSLRHATDFLRPQWAEAPLTWNVPDDLDDQIWDIPRSGEPYDCLDRTLAGYCVSYGVDLSKVAYTVHHKGEDAPIFQLLPPADRSRTRYTALEMLAILRSLRYNEFFVTLSFQNISLDVLHNVRDRYGHDHAPDTTKSGQPLNIPGQYTSTLLVQEVRALAVKSRSLRRLDFSFSLNRGAEQDVGNVQDAGCGICEALFPLCERQWTNIDWIILNGIDLADMDIDYLFSAAIDKSCHFRGLEIGYCGLADRSMQTVLQSISHQAPTMESIDISGNLARQEPKALQDSLSDLEFMRKLNLSNITKTSGPEALLSAQTLCGWKLSELRLSRTSLNQASIESLAHYLISDQSDYLRHLDIDRCGLTSAEAATLLNAMTKDKKKARNLHVNLSENRLEQHHDALVDAVSRSCTPIGLTMQVLEYKSERNFQKLLEAFAKNTSTTFLDISKSSLQKDASIETCVKLRQMLEENHTLEELDISGEHSHLEAANYGSGLNKALDGLTHNQSLHVLRIEDQKLGLQGASTLASVLGVNRTLREIHLESNEINLQAFTVLVNALEHNTTLVYLPPMNSDRAWSQQKVDKEIESIRDTTPSTSNAGTMMPSFRKASVNRTLGRTIGKTIGGATRPFSSRNPDKSESLLYKYSDSDMQKAMGRLSYNWDQGLARLQVYLGRNYRLLHGIADDEEAALDGPPLLDIDRPGTSDSLATALRKIDIDDKTPIAELDRQLVYSDNMADEKHQSEEVVDEVCEESDDMDGGALEMKEHSHV